MEKFAEVEAAKAVMNEAIDWSVLKWLREKKRVRKMADVANARLDQRLKDLSSHGDGAEEAAIHKLQQAGEQARRARMDAEATFDEAEKQLSTALAREGCRKAIHSWELYERAIHLSEDAAGARNSR